MIKIIILLLLLFLIIPIEINAQSRATTTSPYAERIRPYTSNPSPCINSRFWFNSTTNSLNYCEAGIIHNYPVGGGVSGSGTINSLPYWNSTSSLTDSFFMQSGNSTNPRLQLGGTTSSFPALKRSGANIEIRLADDSANTQVLASIFNSTIATGTAPLSIISTTPVVNLHSSPITYLFNGTQFVNPKLVMGESPLTAGSVTITLSGIAVFSSSTSYNCFTQNATAANPTRLSRISGSQFTITGTGTDSIIWMCIGN